MIETYVIGMVGAFTALATYAATRWVWRKLRTLWQRWLDAETALMAHDQMILVIAQHTKTPLCFCDDPECPANVVAGKTEEGKGQYL